MYRYAATSVSKVSGARMSCRFIHECITHGMRTAVNVAYLSTSISHDLTWAVLRTGCEQLDGNTSCLVWLVYCALGGTLSWHKIAVIKNAGLACLYIDCISQGMLTA